MDFSEVRFSLPRRKGIEAHCHLLVPGGGVNVYVCVTCIAVNEPSRMVYQLLFFRSLFSSSLLHRILRICLQDGASLLN